MIIAKLPEMRFLKISSVLDMSEIKLIREHITTVIKKSDVFKDGHFERKPGNLKIKHMQNYCQFLSEFRYKKNLQIFQLNVLWMAKTANRALFDHSR